MRVRHGDDRRLGDRRMAQKHVLDFERIDVLAAGIEHVVGAALEIEEAVGVALEDIAGFQPSVLEALAVDLWQLLIAGRDARISHPQFAMGRGFLTVRVTSLTSPSGQTTPQLPRGTGRPSIGVPIITGPPSVRP